MTSQFVGHVKQPSLSMREAVSEIEKGYEKIFRVQISTDSLKNNQPPQGNQYEYQKNNRFTSKLWQMVEIDLLHSIAK